MAYLGSVLRLLLSAPSDVTEADRQVILRTVNTWNVREGDAHAAAVSLMHWGDHTAAVHGVRPQESINTQLVDRADVVLAIFWHRLGSPTGEADSGTVEELERAAKAGKYVAILICERPASLGEVDTDQLDRLRKFVDENNQNGLIKTCVDEATLIHEVESILLFAAGRASASVGSPTFGPSGSGAEVWATGEATERPKVDPKGKTTHELRHALVLTNRGSLPAYDVTFELVRATAGLKARR